MTIQQKIEKKRERNEFAVAFAVLSFVLVFLLGIAGYDVIGNYNHPANGSEAFASAMMVNPTGQKNGHRQKWCIPHYHDSKCEGES